VLEGSSGVHRAVRRGEGGGGEEEEMKAVKWEGGRGLGAKVGLFTILSYCQY